VELGRKLHAEIGKEWPPEHWEPHVRTHILTQFETHPESVGWHRYVLLNRHAPVLVGCLGAFPCAAGDVEVGYSVVPSYQRQGIGTEAANAFIEWLLQQPTIRTVSAQTFETMPQSIKVMQRCGMKWIGQGDEAGMVKYRRWR
jgi:RimJ/RimL family protein N-acetyltransferase